MGGIVNSIPNLDIFQYLFYSFTIAAIVIGAMFPFVYPYPIFQKASSIKLVTPITFTTQNETMQEVVTLQDDETRNLQFDLSEIIIPDGYSIGYIDVSVTSEEESGISGQCDSVAGDIIMNDLAAQWSDPGNNLSGQDSSCIPIELDLAIYPNFNGESITVSAINEYQALLNWSEEGWGDGFLSIDLDLDVNAPLGFDPFNTDSDEEITVDVYIALFAVSIQEIE